jgi:hypothetical protein
MILSVCSVMTLCAELATAQVQLWGVTIKDGDLVEVVYSKGFASCARMRFSNGNCTQDGPPAHTQDLFCTSGSFVTITVPRSAFVAEFGPHRPVFLYDSTDPSVRSTCVNVGCNIAYGSGCVGSGGHVPSLVSLTGTCLVAGAHSLQLMIRHQGAPGATGALAIGLTRASVPLPMFGCTLLVDPIVFTALVILDSSGRWNISYPLPGSASGGVVMMQGFLVDGGAPRGLAATNGLELWIR